MARRMAYGKAAPNVMRAMLALDAAGDDSGIEPALRDLIKLRASQLNGCAYCVDMHSLDARAGGETEQRLYALPVWRETPFFTERERAALSWTEHLTLIAEDRVPDAAFNEVRQQFSEAEVANLTLIIVLINGWNRFGIAFRDEPGRYTPASRD
jgi:AhpD family alkylhydroperoxidase